MIVFFVIQDFHPFEPKSSTFAFNVTVEGTIEYAGNFTFEKGVEEEVQELKQELQTIAVEIEKPDRASRFGVTFSPALRLPMNCT